MKLGFVSHEADGVAILLWAADPDAPQRLATPFFHAAAAAAMDLPVEVYFSAQSVRLLVPGVAAGLRVSNLHPKTILDTMGEAAAWVHASWPAATHCKHTASTPSA